MRWFFTLLVIATLFGPNTLRATDQINQSTQTTPDQPLRVGLINSPPYVWSVKRPISKRNEGFAFELWQAIAQKNNWECQYIWLSANIEHALEKLARNELDVLVGPVSVSTHRLEEFSFSRPYFITRVGIAVPKASLSFWKVLKLFISNLWNPAVTFVIIIYFFFANMNWYHQRHHNARLSTKYWKGVGLSIWLCFDKLVRLERLFTPNNLHQRLFMGFWLLYCLTVVSGFFGVITSSLTTAMSGFEQIKMTTVQDLSHMKLGALGGSKDVLTARTYANHVVPYPDETSGLKAVQAGEIDGFVGDTPEMSYVIEHDSDLHLTISSLSLSFEEIAFAVLAHQRAFLKQIDLSLTSIQESAYSRDICSQYLGHDSLLCML